MRNRDSTLKGHTKSPTLKDPGQKEEIERSLGQTCRLILEVSQRGNGNPLQYSCLENPRDRGAWWAAICGVAQSWTRLM